MINADQKKAISKIILTCLPEVKAIYLFGSMAKSESRPGSDVDLALWLRVKPEADKVYELKGQLSALTQRDVDLVDLQRADTVTQMISERSLASALSCSFVQCFCDALIMSRTSADSLIVLWLTA